MRKRKQRGLMSSEEASIACGGRQCGEAAEKESSHSQARQKLTVRRLLLVI